MKEQAELSGILCRSPFALKTQIEQKISIITSRKYEMITSIYQNRIHRKKLILSLAATIWILWGVLHIWVGIEGLLRFLSGDVESQWKMLVGGRSVRFYDLQLPQNWETIYAHRHLMLNFCVDVGGYGFLAFFVAWLIWARSSWVGYFIGLYIVGIADLGFFFSMVSSGVAELNIATVIGPIMWAMACSIAPFGLPTLWIDYAND